MKAKAILSAVVFACVSAAAAAAGEMVPFVIPPRAKAGSLPAIRPGGPIDPAGPRIEVRDGHFWRAGRRLRIWGVNLCFGATLPTRDAAEVVAERLARAGINSVRLHHMDSRSFPGGLWDRKNPAKISAEALDRLDYFIDRLARRGIFVNLNLHVGRSYSRFLKLPQYKEMPKYDKILDIFTPRLIHAQQAYARGLLRHFNRYRKVCWADDAAVAFVEITNEDSLFMWDADRRLRRLDPYYSRILTGLWNGYLKKRYGTTEALRRAWSDGDVPAGCSLQAGNVPLFAARESPARKLDRTRFLAVTEKAYFDGMRRFIRQELGCGALVTGTIVFGPAGLYAQSGMDYIDSHAYWHHPRFPHRRWDMGDWFIDNTAMTDDARGGTLPSLACRRLAGKPFTVSEYNHPAPQDSQAECVPMISAFAAAQDWDGVWLFTYGQHGDASSDRAYVSFFDMGANPAKFGFFAPAAVMFRQAGLAPLAAVKVCDLAAGEPLTAAASLHLRYGRSVRAACEGRCKFSWRDILTSRVYVSLGDSSAGPRRTAGRTGGTIEWTFKDGRGHFLARGERALAETGWAKAASGGEPVFRAVMAATLDGRSFAESRKIFIAACGRCENTGMKFSPDRRTVGRNWGRPPVCIEPVDHVLRLPAAAGSTWRLQPLGPDGLPSGPAEQVRAAGGLLLLKLPAASGTMWYLLAR
ncbi:MAG: hypothetical protein J7M21_03590 [Planctomycetes bacterium]|nr:hypothetical protein [Planctomycetota bacterium]